MQTLPVWKSLKFVVWERYNSLPNDKMIDGSKFKAFADDNLNVAEMQNAGYFFP